MENVIEKSKNYVDKHKKYVKMAFELLLPRLSEKFNLTGEQITELKQQIDVHDNSKYSEDELIPYANYFFGEKNDAAAKEFKAAADLHKSRNAHHPEFWQKRGEIMPLNFVIEMVCDWWAFSLINNAPTKTLMWYEMNKKKLNLSPETTKTVEQILGIIKEIANEK